MRGVAIDISGYRHVKEFQARHKQLKGLRADISLAFASGDLLQETLQSCTEALMQNLNATVAGIWMVSADKTIMELSAISGLDASINGAYSRIHINESKIGKIAQRVKPYLSNSLQSDPFITNQEWIESEETIAFADCPLIVENRLVGVLAMFASEPFSEGILEELAIFADDIARGIELKRVKQALAQSEERVQQLQRVESVGKWAGSIAHEFNNMLTVINGYSDLTIRRLKKDTALRSNVEEIKKAGERSALLTYQLLAFSRQQVLKPEIIDLNEIIREITDMLQRLINKDIQLITHLAPQLNHIMADSGQLSHMIMNLVANSRETMPHGGVLTIETRNFVVGKKTKDFNRRQFPAISGGYIKLTISNNGIGMNNAPPQNMFEPFYIDKVIGLGTSLELAMVYDIVKQLGGYIFVDSTIGKGTTFEIYLPRVDKEIESASENNVLK